MKRTPLIASLALLAIICSAAATAGDETKDLFEQIGGKWIEHYLDNDLDGLMALYTEDATVMLHGKPAMQGKPAIQEFFAASMGTAEVTFEIERWRTDVLRCRSFTFDLQEERSGRVENSCRHRPSNTGCQLAASRWLVHLLTATNVYCIAVNVLRLV
jgi:ketosteroid isomerase-like protein